MAPTNVLGLDGRMCTCSSFWKGVSQLRFSIARIGATVETGGQKPEILRPGSLSRSKGFDWQALELQSPPRSIIVICLLNKPDGSGVHRSCLSICNCHDNRATATRSSAGNVSANERRHLADPNSGWVPSGKTHGELTCVMQDVADAAEMNLGQGLRYKDLRRGGGAPVQQGYLTVLHYK